MDTGHRAAGPKRLGPTAGDKLRGPEGDNDGAEHDHGHGSRGLPSLEHHVQENIDEWTRFAAAIDATANTIAALRLGGSRISRHQPIVEFVGRRRRIVEMPDPVARVACLVQILVECGR